MPYVIAQPSVGTKDASCVAVCPTDCIYESDKQYFINPTECIDCGACEPECPAEAIFSEDAVPEKWHASIGANADFFKQGKRPKVTATAKAALQARKGK